MRQADPPPPTSLEGQFLIAMPSLREGPFARSVVYMCAHRDDGAMGIVINHRAEEIDFGQASGAARHRAGNRGDPPAAARQSRARFAGRPGRDGTRLRSSFERLRRQRFDGQDRRCLPDRHARYPARDRRGHRPGAGRARAWLRRLGFGAARERDPRQRLAHLPADAGLIFDPDFARKYDRALAILGVNEGMLSSDAGHA